MRGIWGRILVVELALAGVLCAWQLPRLHFDHNTRSLLREDPVADAREADLVDAFGSEDILLVAWEADALDPLEFERLKAVTADLARIQGLEEVYSLATDAAALSMSGVRIARVTSWPSIVMVPPACW